MYLVGGLVGASAAGAIGTSWGSALAMWIGAAVWWSQLRAALRELATSPSQPRGSSSTEVDHAETRIS
jgi:hypothetical protein